MRLRTMFSSAGAALLAGMMVSSLVMGAAQAEDAKKPNILFIMGDDIGWMQTSYYHRGLMVGETPNIDRIGRKAWPSRTTMPRQAAPPAATPSSPA